MAERILISEDMATFSGFMPFPVSNTMSLIEKSRAQVVQDDRRINLNIRSVGGDDPVDLSALVPLNPRA